MNGYEKGTFGYDLQYLSERGRCAVLSTDDEEGRIIVSPQYQAKVFTSTVQGMAGKSLGFVNYKVFESGEPDEHMNGYGGENRLWIGPEGGRYSVFFKPGVSQVYDNWFTPKALDTEPWEVVSEGTKNIVMEKEMHLMNYLGSMLHMKVSRGVQMMEASSLGLHMGKGVKSVAYYTVNTLTNIGDHAWTPATGAICIWVLDMFRVAPRSIAIVPFVQGDEKELGPVATTEYFGAIPQDRYKEKGGYVFLKTDGLYRSKIGLSGRRTKAIAGSYDPDSHHLAVAAFEVDREGVYLNQEWDCERDPLVGDVFNAYNDGPLANGNIMGPFLELESASPAALIAPGETLSHGHSVFHFVGKDAHSLDHIIEALFGITEGGGSIVIP
ncbi:MAG: hypothetical protein LBK65_07070 [Tannerellaceae bacterium]|jgi:hypothetical protein|nr:hypothetical protein [Tannerellaceae bacterium]